MLLCFYFEIILDVVLIKVDLDACFRLEVMNGGNPLKKNPVCVLDKSVFIFPKSKKLGKTLYM